MIVSKTDYLEIQRSNITIMGTTLGSFSDSRLRRGHWTSRSGVTKHDPPVPWVIMVAPPSSTTNVTISSLMFDGNRYDPLLNVNCLVPEDTRYTGYYDLHLNIGDATGGTFNLELLDFINAPNTALLLGGVNSSVVLSAFGQGTATETAQRTATRTTAIWLDGLYGVVQYNNISFAGTAAINLSGDYQRAYGNWLYSNRYEISDGSGGGQLFVGENTVGAYIASNVIDGAEWPHLNPQPQTLETGCVLPAGQSNAGVEGYGTSHQFYNNAILHHTGSGMQFAGSNPTQQIKISSANPEDSSDTEKYIESNAYGGIYFLGRQYCFGQDAIAREKDPTLLPNPCNCGVTGQAYCVKGATLDNVLVRNNSGAPSVALDSVSDFNGYNGFVYGSCITGNEIDIPAYIPDPMQTLTYPLPVGFNSYLNRKVTPAVFVACPEGSAEPRPAPRPHRPGWPW